MYVSLIFNFALVGTVNVFAVALINMIASGLYFYHIPFCFHRRNSDHFRQKAIY